MVNFHQYFLFLLILFLLNSIPLKVCGQERHHVIVLLDRSGSMRMDEARFNKMLGEELTNTIFKKGVVIPERALLEKEKKDYLSLRTYGLPPIEESPDFDHFLETKRKNLNLKYGLTYSSSWTEDVFKSLAKRITPYFYNTDSSNRFFEYQGKTSRFMARSLAVNECHSKKHRVNRTFLLTLTDDDNPISADQDYEDFKSSGQYAHFDEAFEKINLVEEYYRWTPLKINKRGKFLNDLRVPTSKGKKYILSCFELKRNLGSFHISSLVRFEDNANFLKKKNDYICQYRIALKNKQNLPENIKNLSVVEGKFWLEDSNNTYQSSTITFSRLNMDTVLNFKLPLDIVKNEDLYLLSKFWVHSKDPAYGALISSPDDMEIGRGLQVQIPVQFEPDKKILGIFPINSGMYLGMDSQSTVKKFWEILFFLLLFTLVAIILLWRILTGRTIKQLSHANTTIS